MTNISKIIISSAVGVALLAFAQLAFADTSDFVPSLGPSDTTDTTMITATVNNSVEGASDAIPSTGGSNNAEGGTNLVASTTGSNGAEAGTTLVPTNTGANSDEAGTSLVPTMGGSNSDEMIATTSSSTIPSNGGDNGDDNNNGGGSNGGGGGGSGATILTASTGGAVGGGSAGVGGTIGTLGTSTLACPFLTGYIIPGAANLAADIAKLQLFFNLYTHTHLTVNGILGPDTIAAINAFQTAHLADIMGPWGATQASGKVYITTLKEINAIVCAAPKVFNAEELAIIAAYKAQLAANGAGDNGANGGTAANPDNSSSTSPVITTSSTTPSIINSNASLVGNALGSVGGFFQAIISKILSWF